MKSAMIMMIAVSMIFTAYSQDTTEYNEPAGLVNVIEENGVTTIWLGSKEILNLEESDEGVQIKVHDDDLVTILHDDNRVIFKLKGSEISEILNENAVTSEEDINKAIGEINEQLLRELENSKIDEDEVDIEIEDDEVHFDLEEFGLLEIRDYDDGVKITIREKPLLDYREDSDTTKIRFGKKGIKIIEDEDGNTSVKVLDIEDEEEDTEFDDEVSDKHRGKDFKGHWAGFQIGLNNYFDPDFNLSRTEGEEYMDLNTGRSVNVNINFLEYGVGLGTDRIGLTTGMGFEFSNYFFDNNNNIVKNQETGFIEELDYNDLGINLAKSKLTTTYLTVPLILETQIGGNKRSKRLHISAGIIGSLKIGSHTKVVYKESGSKQKDKNRDDFNLNSLRYGLTASIGYQALNLYANYYLMPLFETDKGPELYPFNVGVAFFF
jgi:hypothetical protein